MPNILTLEPLLTIVTKHPGLVRRRHGFDCADGTDCTPNDYLFEGRGGVVVGERVDIVSVGMRVGMRVGFGGYSLLVCHSEG